ncbi:MAG: hypothetical protein ACJ8F7_17415 [Gemmataceae bacterium]
MKRVIVGTLLGLLAATGCKSTTSQSSGGGVLQQVAATQPANAPATVTPAVVAGTPAESAKPMSYTVDSPFGSGACSH